MRPIKLALCVWLLSLNLAWATLPFYTTWEVRTTGADTNSGGFDPGTASGGANGSGCTGGTDRSKSDTPFVAFDGATITATTAGVGAVLTITGYTPVTADKCNIIQITGGVNFTTGFYAITASAAGTWTLDRNATTGAGTAMTGAMGGALLTQAKLFTAIVSGTTLSKGMYAWVKAGTYTQTAVAAMSGTINNFTIEGYQTTRGDLGTKPLITTATNSTKLVSWGSSVLIYGVKYRNMSFSNTAGTRDVAIYASTGGAIGSLNCEFCLFTGFTNAINGGYDGSGTFYWPNIILRSTEFTANTASGILAAGSVSCDGCYFHDQGAPGIVMTAGPGGLTPLLNVNNSVFDTLGGATTLAGAIRYNDSSSPAAYSVRNSDFYNTTGSAIYLLRGLNSYYMSGNVFDSNSRYGIENTNTNGVGDLGQVFSKQNAFYNNTLGASLLWPVDSTDITLTASPFTNAAGADFTLNNTSGGGAALKAACYPGVIPSAGTGYIDCGALQSAAAAGASNSAYVQ